VGQLMSGRAEFVELRDGSRVGIRPIESEDKQRLSDAFDHLSEESRYRRFLHPIKYLSPRDLSYFTEVDHHDHEALIALDVAEHDAVGIARCIRSPTNPEEAEFAIAIVDDWQGRGLGTELLVRLMKRALAEGIRRFTALMVSNNKEALELVEHVAPSISRSSSAGVTDLVIDLPERPHLLTTNRPHARASDGPLTGEGHAG
jgi:GNAT superfamily N-acetyltransferase